MTRALVGARAHRRRPQTDPRSRIPAQPADEPPYRVALDDPRLRPARRRPGTMVGAGQRRPRRVGRRRAAARPADRRRPGRPWAAPGWPTCRWRPCAAGCWCPRPSRGCSPGGCASELDPWGPGRRTTTRCSTALDVAAARRRAGGAARGPGRAGRRGRPRVLRRSAPAARPGPGRCSPTATCWCSSSRPARSTRTPRCSSRTGCGPPGTAPAARRPADHGGDQRQPAAAGPVRRGGLPRRRPGGRRPAAPRPARRHPGYRETVIRGEEADGPPPLRRAAARHHAAGRHRRCRCASRPSCCCAELPPRRWPGCWCSTAWPRWPGWPGRGCSATSSQSVPTRHDHRAHRQAARCCWPSPCCSRPC